MKDNISNQEQHINQLDTKASNLMTAATGLVGSGLAVQAGILAIGAGSSSPPSTVNHIVQFIASLVLLGVYAPTITYAILGYKIRTWTRAIIPVTLPDTNDVVEIYQGMKEKYTKSEDENKEEMNAEMLHAYYTNSGVFKNKASSIHTANIWLGIETVVFALFLVLQVILAFRLF
jgi:hypothetical protein